MPQAFLIPLVGKQLTFKSRVTFIFRMCCYGYGRRYPIFFYIYFVSGHNLIHPIMFQDCVFVDKFISVIHSSSPSFIKYDFCLPFSLTGLTSRSTCMCQCNPHTFILNSTLRHVSNTITQMWAARWVTSRLVLLCFHFKTKFLESLSPNLFQSTSCRVN